MEPMGKASLGGITSVLGGLVPTNPSIDSRIFTKVWEGTQKHNKKELRYDTCMCTYIHVYCKYIYIYIRVYGSNVSSVLGLERFNRRPFLIKRRHFFGSVEPARRIIFNLDFSRHTLVGTFFCPRPDQLSSFHLNGTSFRPTWVVPTRTKLHHSKW